MLSLLSKKWSLHLGRILDIEKVGVHGNKSAALCQNKGRGIHTKTYGKFKYMAKIAVTSSLGGGGGGNHSQLTPNHPINHTITNLQTIYFSSISIYKHQRSFLLSTSCSVSQAIGKYYLCIILNNLKLQTKSKCQRDRYQSNVLLL